MALLDCLIILLSPLSFWSKFQQIKTASVEAWQITHMQVWWHFGASDSCDKSAEANVLSKRCVAIMASKPAGTFRWMPHAWHQRTMVPNPWTIKTPSCTSAVCDSQTFITGCEPSYPPPLRTVSFAHLSFLEAINRRGGQLMIAFVGLSLFSS